MRPAFALPLAVALTLAACATPPPPPPPPPPEPVARRDVELERLTALVVGSWHERLSRKEARDRVLGRLALRDPPPTEMTLKKLPPAERARLEDLVVSAQGDGREELAAWAENPGVLLTVEAGAMALEVHGKPVKQLSWAPQRVEDGALVGEIVDSMRDERSEIAFTFEDDDTVSAPLGPRGETITFEREGGEEQ